jgi:hypothetical protein
VSTVYGKSAAHSAESTLQGKLTHASVSGRSSQLHTAGTEANARFRWGVELDRIAWSLARARAIYPIVVVGLGACVFTDMMTFLSSFAATVATP